MITYDVHLNKDNVSSALYNLDVCIKNARLDKDRLIQFITGFGSKSNSHKIKDSIIFKLDEYKAKNIIKAYIIGSDIKDLSLNYIEFLKYFKKEVPKDMIKNANNGIIYIKL